MELSYKLVINGVDKTKNISGRLDHFSLTEYENGNLDSLIININNADNKLEPINKTAKLELSIGFKGLTSLGEFVVQKAAHTDSIITIYATPQDLTVARDTKTRVFEQKSLEDVLQTIASSLQLKLQLDSNLKSKQIPYLLQNNQSDLSILHELGELYYAIASIKNGELIFIAKDTVQEKIDIKDSEILSIHKPDNSEYKHYYGVKANFWDTKTATKQIIELGTAPFLYLRSYYGLELTKEQVKSKYKQIQEKDLIEVQLLGNPKLQVGASINISKDSSYIDFIGNYKIKQTKHQLKNGAFTNVIYGYKLS